MKIKIAKWLAEIKQLPNKIDATIEHETDKAYLINYNNRQVWIPKKTKKGQIITEITGE